MPAPLRAGSFFICLPAPPAGGGGADPIVNKPPPAGGRGGAACWKGDVVWELVPPPKLKPPPLGVPGAGGKLVLPLGAGDAGWLDPNANGLLAVAGDANPNGVG